MAKKRDRLLRGGPKGYHTRDFRFVVKVHPEADDVEWRFPWVVADTVECRTDHFASLDGARAFVREFYVNGRRPDEFCYG